MTIALALFTEEIDRLIKDDDVLLVDTEKVAHVKAALERYGHDHPDDVTADVTGDGGKYYAITTALTSWVEDFSQVLSIQYPAPVVASDQEPQYLEPDDWQDDYWAGGVHYLYLPNHAPAATESFRVRYSIPYTLAGATQAANVPPQDFYAVCYLAASIGCDAIAAKFSQIGDSSLSVDSTSHTTKAGEFRAQARAYQARYEQHLGLGKFAEPATGAAEFVDWDTSPEFPYGRDYIHHHRGLR